MTRLLYDSQNDKKVTRIDMSFLPTPAPLGPRHRPYPFADFANNTVSALERAGFQIMQEDYAVTKDDSRMFGLISIKKKPEPTRFDPGRELITTDRNWNLLVGLRGSHDQKFSRALSIGTEVMVCSNLCFHADLGVWNTKQTTRINERMPHLIFDAVQGVSRSAAELTVDFDMFNSTALSRVEGDKILVDAYRAGGFSRSQLGKALDDWQTCSVEEHTANGRNLWWLFNSCTHALKPGGSNTNHNDLRDRSMIIYSKLRPIAKQAQIGVRPGWH